MARKCVPMIHVPDVRATVEWYEALGFSVLEAHGDHRGGLSFAMLAFGSGEVMFSSGGSSSTRERREVDLYVYTDDVDGLHDQIADRVEVVEAPHETFYGMRELIIRDPNRFWITFGEVSPGEILMAAVARADAQGVRAALARPGLSPERLSAALSAASSAPDSRAEIVALLEQAGAIAAPVIAETVLESYAGRYQSQDGIGVQVVRDGNALRVLPDDSQPVRMLPTAQATFKPIELVDASVTFETTGGRVTALVFSQGAQRMHLRRVEDR